jgi:flavin-dependent dehydrogenase
MYDAIVVGARCGGAPTAMLLARRGCKVLLVDRNAFPSEIPHGHFVHKHGPLLLQRWGLLDRIVQSGCPAIRAFTMDLGDFPLTALGLEMDGVAFGYGPRRRVLDQILIYAASEAGVEFRPNYSVERYLAEDDRITGIRGNDTRTRSAGEEHACITIGADGRNSLLAHTVLAASYADAGALACWYFSYWSGVPQEGLEMYARERRVIFAFPTSDGLIAVFLGCPAEEFATIKQDLDTHFRQSLALVPEFWEKLSAGSRVERYYGTADLPNFLRKPFGPGWALVGDSGCHKDPFLALGICDAFRDAELLSDAVHQGLSGVRPIEEALATYEVKRNEAVMPDYTENINLARFGPPAPEVLKLRLAIRDDPVETRRFFLARQGRIPPGDFFNPENMRRLLSRLPRAAAQ